VKARVPWITLAVALAAIVIPGRFEYDRTAILRGEVWRLVTGHLTHWSPDHLLWDVVAFVTLGFVCERRHAFYGTVLLASALSVSLVLWIVCPEVTAYRGLSAVASALWFWAALIIAERRLMAGFVLLALFFGKVLIELSTGTSIFASGITVLPSVHLIGAAAGFCGAYLERKMTRLTNAAVHPSRSDHHFRRRRNEPAVVGRVA
jgi:rhomboid family GlyGly-CTERM serine protease